MSLDMLQSFGSQATTLEELKKELETKKIQVKNEFDLQEKEIYEMKKHQSLLQKELNENDKVEKELTAEIEIAKENIADRKRKEKELSKNSTEIKDQYKNSCKELAQAQQEYDNLQQKKRDMLVKIENLHTEIETLRRRKEQALETQREKKKEFNQKTKQMVTTEKEYMEREAELKKEVEKWESELSKVKDQYKKEEDELEKKIQSVEAKQQDTKEQFNRSRETFEHIRKSRDAEIGGPSLDDKYKEHDTLVEEIYKLEAMLEAQKLAEDFFLKQAEQLLSQHEQKILKEHEQDLEEFNNPSKRKTISEEEKKKQLQRKKQNRYGTAEHFMLRKVKAEIDMTNKFIEMAKSFTPSFTNGSENQSDHNLNEKVLNQFFTDQKKQSQDEKLYEYVEMMRVLKLNKTKEEILKKAIHKVSSLIGEDVTDIIELIDNNPFDDYPYEVHAGSEGSKPKRPLNDEYLVKSRFENLLADEPPKIINVNELLKLKNDLKEKDLEFKWLETKKKIISAFTDSVLPNLKQFEEIQSKPELLRVGYQTVLSSPFHHNLKRKQENRIPYLDKLDSEKSFILIEETGDLSNPLKKLNVTIKSDRKSLIINMLNGEEIVLNLKDVVDVLSGYQTRALLEYGEMKREHVTFSIVSPSVILNFEVIESEKRDEWVKVLLSLMFESRLIADNNNQ